MDKKAAMFGLDARIALAIFGALSVISGAALYSAIQNSKAIALLTEMNEVGKAYESYILDTGQDLSIYTSIGIEVFSRQTSQLVSNSITGWNGPYLNYKPDTIYPKRLKHHTFGEIGINFSTNLPWGDAHANTNWAYPAVRCTSSNTCFAWVEFNNIPGNLNNKIDQIIDGGDGSYSGSFRWYTFAGKVSYMLKYMPSAFPI